MVDLVYFTLAHLRSGGNLLIPKGTEGARSTEVAHKDDMDAAKRTIMSMTEFVEVVGGSQRFLTRKLERHKKTMVRPHAGGRAVTRKPWLAFGS